MEDLFNSLLNLFRLSLLIVVSTLLWLAFPFAFKDFELSWPSSPNAPEVTAFVTVPSGLEEGAGKNLVEKHCLSCHSAQLIIQNRMDADTWRYTIHWMQQTQGLWDLGKDEARIVEYLGTYYAPLPESRRKNLDIENIQWYILQDDTTDL